MTQSEFNHLLSSIEALSLEQMQQLRQQLDSELAHYALAQARLPIGGQWLFGVRDDMARADFWAGRAKCTYTVLGILYLLIACGAVVEFSISPFKKIAELGACQRFTVIVIGIILSAGPPLYFWLEARAFDWWLNQKFPGVEQQKQFRETYKLNADNIKAFWSGIGDDKEGPLFRPMRPDGAGLARGTLTARPPGGW